mgnify:CR=1 FL=1
MAEQQPEEARPASLPPDPEAYDSPRAVQGRARGLAAPYIPGGTHPDAETTRLREQRYVRLLTAMVVVVVDGGTPETLSSKEPVPPPKPSTKM